MFKFKMQLPPYVFHTTLAEKAKLVGEGKSVIDLSMGNPDGAPPPSAVKQLLATSILPEAHRYGPSLGLVELREDVVRWYGQHHTTPIGLENVTLTHGAKEALTQLAAMLVSPGDRVVVPTPCYPIHRFAFEFAGADIIEIELNDSAKFIAELKKVCEAEDIAGVVVNFPHNPTGCTISEVQAKELADICTNTGAWCVHDFAYSDIYTTSRPPSILKYMAESCVEILSLSKTYNIPGWRIGLVAGRSDIMQPFATVKQYLGYGSFVPLQYGAHKAMCHDEQYCKNVRATYNERRAAFCTELGIDTTKQDGMFVWWHVGGDDLNYVLQLVRDTGVLLSPGSGFGSGGAGFVRAALIEPPEVLIEAAKAIKNISLAESKLA